MSKSDAYFQFPLSMLRDAKDSPGLVHDASAMAMLTYGESMDEDTRDALLQECCIDYDDCDDDQMNVAAGAWRLNITVGNVERTAINARRLKDKHRDGGMQVRLRTDLAWSAHDDDWPLLKLKTLCGVYAGIGNRPAQKLNHRLLRAYCSGFQSPKGLKEKQMIPTSSLRYWLEQLWFKNLFQFCLHGRERWYSKSLKDDRALALLVKSKRQGESAKKVISTKDV